VSLAPSSKKYRETIVPALGSTGWIRALDEAIEGARSMLVMATPAALRSKWVAEEWAKFYRVMVDHQAGTLVSLLSRGQSIADLPLTLKQHQVLESRSDRDYPALLTRILDLVGRR
jgi:hypothetical protein